MIEGKTGAIIGLIRTIFGGIDCAFYTLLGWVMQTFFDISTAQFFSGEFVYDFFTRVQLIIGVFMVFKLTISILQALVNPDKITEKNTGFSSVIIRIVTCLVMLVLLVPVNIPDAKNNYEIEINNNGLLFGTLYSLQDRIIGNNTLGKLILGDNTTAKTAKEQNSQYQTINENLRVTIAKGFVRVVETGNGNALCPNEAEAYKNFKTVNELYDHLNDSCNGNYAYAYTPLLGTILAIAFAVVFIGLSIDITVRVIKLAFLRLLAPIPIISYIDPNQEKKGAFANWVKMLTSTYLDLFIRLAIVYFVVFLIDGMLDMIFAGTFLNMSSSSNSIMLFVIITLGLLVFAKQAVKFIKDVLGIQGSIQNAGLSSILGGTAMVAGGAGLAGFAYGAMNGAKAQIDGANQGKPVPLGAAWSQNQDLMAKIRTGDKDAQGGLFGGLHDRLNYETRDKAASRLGYSRENLALANWNKKDLQTKLGAAESEVANAQTQLENFRATADKNNPGYGTELEALTKNLFEARTKRDRLAMDADKAAKNAKAIEDFRTQMGAGPRIMDTVLYDQGISGEYKQSRRQYRANYRTVEKPILRNDGMPDNVKNNFTVDADVFNPFKNNTGQSSGGTDTTRVDDDSYSSMGHGASGGGPGGPPPGGY